jgi:hypothetical protein
MAKRELVYSGSRDPRFVTLRRGGMLDEAQHHLLVLWAADCAEHVLELFTSQYHEDDRVRQAILQAHAWADGKISMTQAREAAYAAHDAARVVSGAARETAHAAGHAAAVAHMADHELGAAAYAIRAVRAAAALDERDTVGWAECCWQREQLTVDILALVLEDEAERNKKFWGLFKESE